MKLQTRGRRCCFCSGWWKRRDEPRPPGDADQKVRAMMDDIQHGLAKYELGIKSSCVIFFEGCFCDKMSHSLVQRKLNADNCDSLMLFIKASA